MIHSIVNDPLAAATVPLYIVQKSWFDGPHVTASMDLPMLFASRSKAEEGASQSAHAHANSHGGEPVRTILNGQEYAFATRGKLFWIRPVDASIVFDAQHQQCKYHTAQQAGDLSATTIPTEADGNLQAYCVMTRNVIGGTGNPNSRRGSEQRQHCVVLATDEAAAASRLVRPTPESQIVVLPVVEDDIFANRDVESSILQAWPDANEWFRLPQSQDMTRKRDTFMDLQDISRTQQAVMVNADRETHRNKRRAL